MQITEDIAMTKKIVFSLALILAAAVAHGEQKDGFWDKLQYKLEKVTPAKKASSTTAVGGVRGAKNDDAADIYWKGKDKSSELNEEELQKFNLAVESKLKGDNESALKQFDEFLAVYPHSAFRVEGLQAVDKIKLEIAAAKNPPKAEPAAAPQREVAAPPGEAAAPARSEVAAPPRESAAPTQVPTPESVSEPVK